VKEKIENKSNKNEMCEKKLEMDPHQHHIIKIPEGILEWIEIPSDKDNRHKAFIMGIEVAPQYRRKGYGTKLFQMLCDVLMKKRIWNMELDNCSDEDNTFYERLGFVYKERHDNAMICKTHVIYRNIEKMLQ